MGPFPLLLRKENTNSSFFDDNDISYAKETTFSNDDNLSFKSFFSWNKEKKAKNISKPDSIAENFDISRLGLDIQHCDNPERYYSSMSW
jgi:hypothetical protein